LAHQSPFHLLSPLIKLPQKIPEHQGRAAPRGIERARREAVWGRGGRAGPARVRLSPAPRAICAVLSVPKKKSVVVYRGHRVDPSDIFTWLGLSQEQTTPHLRLRPYRSDHTGTGSLLGFGCHAFATCLSST